MENLCVIDNDNKIELKEQRKYNLESLPLRLLAFLFPFLTMISAFAIMEIYPIGDRMILTVDCYHQYAPFLCELREKIITGKSLFYSWDCGLGNEFYAAFANYSASPLNLLCVFFTPKAIPVFIAFITAVRAGLASTFMSMFLSDEDEGRYDLVTVIFSASYALCGWFLTDFWNIMWCDAVVLLPLVCLGLRKLFIDNKFTLYVASLAILIISNYYTGYFICIFLVLFAPVYYLIVHKPQVKSFFRCAFNFAFGSLVAGMISAVVVLPTYSILQHSSAVGDKFPKDYKLTGNLFDFLGRFMVAANPNIRDGMANVFCGTLVILLIPLFFMAPKESGITLRRKIGLGVLFLVFYLSFTNRTLNYIWHGFHFPNQIPYRQSFLISFLLVYTAYSTIRIIRFYTPGQISAVTVGAIVFLVMFEKFGAGKETYVQIGLTFVFIIIQGSVLRAMKTANFKNPMIMEYVITGVTLIEIFATSCLMVSFVGKNEGFTVYDFFGKNRNAVRSYVAEVEGSEGHKTFERSELYPNNICDMLSVYDVKGMSIFSSTARESLVKYMRNFGFHNNGINGLRNAGLTRVTASLLGIRNLIAVDNASALPVVYDEEYNDGKIKVYGNPDALAVGYMVSSDILYYEPEYTFTDVFAKTNEWVRAMGVEADVFLPAEVNKETVENMNFTGRVGSYLSYTVVDANKAAVMTVTVNGNKLGEELYLYTNSSKGGRVHIWYEDGSLDYSYDIRSYQTICLGKYEGKTYNVEIRYSKPPTGNLHLYAYELNDMGYEVMLEQLSDKELYVTSYDTTGLKGTVDVKEDGILLLTIQYSEGFELKVDGKKAELLGVSDALCAVELTAGTHSIELTYKPPMFNPGLIITVAGLVIYAALIVVPIIVNKRRKAAK